MGLAAALPFGARAAILCLATLIATPYALDYDLMLLAPALALIAAEGKVRGFRPYELSLLTLLWLLPFAARNLAAVSHLLAGALRDPGASGHDRAPQS